MKEDIGIYIHIPFCSRKCYYCNFTSFEKEEEKIEEYIDALCIEILKNAEILSQYNIKTVYFGGGTPSYIDAKYIEKIMNTLKLFSKSNLEESENIDNNKEFIEVTIEVNPNSVTLEKLTKYKNCGINRISVGMQSTHDIVLKSIGRLHNAYDIENTLDNIKKVGIDNVSVDLIYPLPNLNLKMFEETLNKVNSFKEKYNVKHVSIYNLEVHENTKLHFLLKEKFLALADEDEEYLMKEMLNSKLVDFEFNKYEISNFSLKGYESKHNLMYWNQEKYLGFGVGASSFFYGCRYKNTDNINEYIDGIYNDKNIISEKEELDKLDLMKEYIILNLRLVKGINTKEFFKRFNKDIFELFKTEFDYLIANNLIINNDGRLYLSKRGQEVANIVWEKFI